MIGKKLNLIKTIVLVTKDKLNNPKRLSWTCQCRLDIYFVD